MTLIDEPLLTHVIPREQLQLDPNSVYLFGRGIEDRALLESNWRADAEADGTAFVEVTEIGDVLSLRSADATEILTFSGRSRAKAKSFFASNSCYIDITGMQYSAWGPLVLAAVEAGSNFRVVYVEPSDYRRSSTPTQGMYFDLSEGFDGIRPIPGFAALRVRANSDWHLVAALGFEGVRFSYILNELEPARDRVYPIVGVPGFRPEFAAHALTANRADLEDLTVIPNIRFARANCPFDMFHALRDIHADVGGAQLRLAPIGTKPHGLGALLYTISSPSNVQLIHDHPRRKAKRTLGVSRVCVYEVSTFCESDLFRNPIIAST
jgi:hypothetical protein